MFSNKLNIINIININNAKLNDKIYNIGDEHIKQLWQTPKFELLSRNETILSGTIIGPEGSGSFYVS